MTEALLLVLALGGPAALGMHLIFNGPALGWDEAVYATRTRSLVTDIPASAWALYRPPALPLLGVLAAPVGISDVSLRTVTLVLAIATLAATWALGRLIAGTSTAFVAVLGAMALPVVVAELPMFHNDLTSAGLLVALMVLLWLELEVREAPGPGLLLAGVVAAATFYVRFGALPALVGVGLATLVLWAPRLRSHWRLASATVGVVIALAVPHVASAARATGSPLGIVTMSVDQADTTGPAASLRGYVRWLPDVIAGPIGLTFLAAGGILVAVLVVRRLVGRDTWSLGRPVIWLTLPALVTVAALVLVSHPEPRYVLFPLLLGVILGATALVRAAALVRVAPGRSVRWARWVPATLAWGALALAVTLVVVRHATAEVRGWSDRGPWIADAGRWIRDHSDRPCLVATTIAPVLSWYSECAASQMQGAPLPAYAADPPPDATFIVFTTIDERRKSAGTLQRYHALARRDPAATFRGEGGAAEVFLAGP